MNEVFKRKEKNDKKDRKRKVNNNIANFILILRVVVENEM